MPGSSEDSELIDKGPCPKCGSSDGNALYSDNHQFCYVCNTYTPPDEDEERPIPTRKSSKGDLLPPGEYRAIPARSLTEETVRKWGYSVGKMHGEPVQIANYRNDAGQIIAQKVRTADKDFVFLGDGKTCGLYGQHLWRDGGKRVVITEGEIDAMSVSQIQGHKWPVVSLPKGAAGAKKSVQAEFEWLDRFDEIVLMFDNDEPGQEAVEAVGELRFSPGKLKVAKLPLKDANDMLKAGRGAEVVNAIFAAKPYRPDGIVDGSEVWDAINATDETVEGAYSYPFEGLQEKLNGAHPGQVITLTAGSGVGKTEVVREITYGMLNQGATVGLMMLEEDLRRTARGFVGLALNRPAHLEWDDIPEEDRRRGYEATLGTGRMFLYDHFGSTALDNLLSKLRYLAVGCGCNVIVLDHISIVVSGIGDGDERRLIDNIMTELKRHAMELGIILFIISHLRRPSEGKGHEEGATTSLSQLRGSHAIAQLSDTVIGLERNQQGDHPNVTTLRVLKNRRAGITGKAGWLSYDHTTGRLTELASDPFNKEKQHEDYSWDEDETDEVPF